MLVLLVLVYVIYMVKDRQTGFDEDSPRFLLSGQSNLLINNIMFCGNPLTLVSPDYAPSLEEFSKCNPGYYMVYIW